MILLYQTLPLKASPMKNSTIRVNGGALPKIDRAGIMLRAWAIFRTTYRFPQISFASIGRPCFTWALKQAWAEAAPQPALLPSRRRSRSSVSLIGALTTHQLICSASVSEQRKEVKQSAL
jgi:hypothetical protein